MHNSTLIVLAESFMETILLVSIVGFFALLLGIFLGVCLFSSQEKALSPNIVIFTFLNITVNIIRAIPFVILLILMLPITAKITGTILGFKAAIPALIVAIVPFFARIVYLSLNEIPKGVIEALQAMGTNKPYLIILLVQEAKNPLIAGFTITLITLVSFIASTAIIGSGGLGATAYIKGFQRNNLVIMYLATLLTIFIVFFIQFLGDAIIKYLNKNIQ